MHAGRECVTGTLRASRSRDRGEEERTRAGDGGGQDQRPPGQTLGEARQHRGLQAQDEDDRRHAVRAAARVPHDREGALPRPASAEPVARVGEPVEVQASGQRRPQRDQQHGADARRHDAVDRERREGQTRAEREPDHGEPAGRPAEVAGDAAPRERQDRQVAEGDQRASEGVHGRADGRRVVA